jgi:hypothetical protein
MRILLGSSYTAGPSTASRCFSLRSTSTPAARTSALKSAPLYPSAYNNNSSCKVAAAIANSKLRTLPRDFKMTAVWTHDANDHNRRDKQLYSYYWNAYNTKVADIEVHSSTHNAMVLWFVANMLQQQYLSMSAYSLKVNVWSNSRWFWNGSVGNSQDNNGRAQQSWTQRSAFAAHSQQW